MWADRWTAYKKMNQTLKALSEVIKQYPLDEKLLFGGK